MAPLKKGPEYVSGITITNGGVCPNELEEGSLARAILTNYNPRHVPTMIGNVWIMNTLVSIEDADEAADPRYVYDKWGGEWPAGGPNYR
jgi:hypothetical protein